MLTVVDKSATTSEAAHRRSGCPRRPPAPTDGGGRRQGQAARHDCVLLRWAIRDPARNPKANPMIMGDFNEGEPVGSRSPSFAGAACNFRIPNWSKLPVGSRLKARSWLASRKSSSAKTWRHSSTRPSQGAGGPTRRFSCGAATPGDRPSRRRHPRRLQGVWSGRQASTGVRPGKGQPLP